MLIALRCVSRATFARIFLEGSFARLLAAASEQRAKKRHKKLNPAAGLQRLQNELGILGRSV